MICKLLPDQLCLLLVGCKYIDMQQLQFSVMQPQTYSKTVCGFVYADLPLLVPLQFGEKLHPC